MRRASLERGRALRVWRAHLAYVHQNRPIGCDCELQPNRFRKTERIAGCRNSRCFLCHAGKLSGRPTPQEVRAILSHREWAAELGRHGPRLRRIY